MAEPARGADPTAQSRQRVYGGALKMWEHRFRDSVLQGAVLVGTHTDEETRAARAVEALRDSGAERVDCFDASGEPAEQPAAR